MRQEILNLLPGFMANSLRTLKAHFIRLVYLLTADHKLTPMQRFQRDGFASLLTRGLSLGPASTVLDIGGHVGVFTDSVLALGPCRVEVFEPMPDFAERLKHKYSQRPNVTVHPYGLSAKDGRRVFHVHDDGTGEFVGGAPVEVPFQSLSSVLPTLPETFNLVAINIEGGEYELLPLLIDSGAMLRIERLVVQFHRLGSDAESRREDIRNALAATHKCLWNYDFVWECWERSRH